MCVIIQLLAGKSVNSIKLFNAAANNWHSWGIIIKRPGQKSLEVIRRVPANVHLADAHPDVGGCWKDIPEIETILNDNIDCERYIHFRHATAGLVNEENCHPFVLEKNKHVESYMMHNGAFSGTGISYGAAWQNNHSPKPEESDTNLFVKNFLAEPLKEFAKGDYTNEAFVKYYWTPLFNQKGGSSTVLFVSNVYETVRHGTWVTFVNTAGEGVNRDEKDVAYYASNDQYFDRVKRGPLFFYQQEEERKAREKEQARTKAITSSVPVKDSSGKPGSTGITITTYEHGVFQPDPEVLRGLTRIFQQFGANLEPGHIADLYECGLNEFEAVVTSLVAGNDEKVIAAFIDFLIGQYRDLYNDFNRINVKKKEAEKLIAELKKIEPSMALVAIEKDNRDVA